MYNATSYITQIGIAQISGILPEKSDLSNAKAAFIEIIFHFSL